MATSTPPLYPAMNGDEQSKRVAWQVPVWTPETDPRYDYNSIPRKEVHQWIRQQVADGKEYQECSPGFMMLEESIRILSGKPTEKLAVKQKDDRYSRLQTNRLKRNTREMVNALSEVRYTPGYRSDANEFQDQATVFNRVGHAWYLDMMADLKIKKGVQWAAISPSGWMEIQYRRIPGERGRKEIDLIPHSHFDVVCTGMPESGDHQEAYTVTIIKHPPVYLAHGEWPDFQAILIPDRETPKGWKERLQAVSDWFYSDNIPEKTTARNPTVTMYYTYVLDLSINQSGQPMKMGYIKSRTTGELLPTPWSYDVPSMGSNIEIGKDSNGTPLYKLADADDARIFPGRRLIVSTEKYTLYDGPMQDWHGMVPLFKIACDAWPFAEFSLVHDVATIHDTIGEVERVTHQTVRNRFNPTMLFNWRAIDRNKAKALRTDIQGQRVGFNGNEANTARAAVDTLTGPEFNKIDDWISLFVKDLREQEDYQMGVTQAVALAKMKAGGSQDQLEKMLEMAGPIVKGISRDMERSFRDMANIFKYLVLQYYTTPKLMAITGKDGITPENYDYQPGNLIPSHMPGEDKEKPSRYSDAYRARYLADHVKFFIVPNTMHEIVQTSQKLLYLQLWRQGFPIDPWTLADVMGIANFGKVPEGTNCVWDRWMAWQRLQLHFKVAMAAEAKMIAQQLGLDDEETDGGGGGGGGSGGGRGGSGPNTPGTGPKGGPRGSGGRAPTGQTPPQMVQKDGGTRTTVSESQK